MARFEGTIRIFRAWKCSARELLLELMILASTSVMGLRTERMWRTCSLDTEGEDCSRCLRLQVSRMTIGSPTMPILASGTKGDNFYTLVRGQNTKKEDGNSISMRNSRNGVLHVVDTEAAARQDLYTPDHFAPNSVGRPMQGYLLSVLQVDTAANSRNFYDVAVLTARGPSAYSKEFHKAYRGAVAAGDTVTVLHGSEEHRDREIPDGWCSRPIQILLGAEGETTYQTGGSYQFVMPEHDTEVSAVYKKVAAGVRVEPQEFGFRVIEERTGDRMNPSITTEVRDTTGKLLARYLNGKLESGTKVYSFLHSRSSTGVFSPVFRPDPPAFPE